ncbi:MAG: hypothetical protein AUK47_23200 [Deltaproteobacteria bacterium CG2_30_63_29]|nr:MAG: hypothetical protein AUK47_23200 [Deltaproteobacteria bacterium CG2_30_63_29]PJB49083.1 MAG: hypothetical protein CO108_01015 [Deltaproteobacteria bacterium CG_4_9_14_3_um_filter_63_12]
MISPSNYYKASDSIVQSMSDVGRNIKAVQDYAQEKGLKVFWRGQANHEWGLVSSLARRLAASGPVDDKTLCRVEDKLLEEATSWVQEISEAKYANPLAKLAYLQHHGVPTRLLDFTSSPWMAVFFATEAFDEIDGRVFAILVDDAAVLTATPADTPWRKYKTDEIKVYDAVSAGVSFPRLAAQSGVLALGRLPSTTPYRKAFDSVLDVERSLLAEEVRRILSIPFKLNPFDPTKGKACLPKRARTHVGLTFRIHVDKESVRRDLAGAGSGKKISPPNLKIAHKSVYPDIGGMVAHSKTLTGLDRGLLII